MQFDKLTKTKTVETLLGKVWKDELTPGFFMIWTRLLTISYFDFFSQLQGSGLENLVSWLIESFRSGSTEDTDDEKYE
jgi:hypothetical protein